MALLYERSRVWRVIVQATKDPRILFVFAGSTVLAASAFAWGARSLTESSAKDTHQELEKLRGRDKETARYAKHSKEALATLFEQVHPNRDRESARILDESRKAGKPPIKLPGVAWHPRVATPVANKKESKPAEE
jgi:hypothetical protein